MSCFKIVACLALVAPILLLASPALAQVNMTPSPQVCAEPTAETLELPAELDTPPTVNTIQNGPCSWCTENSGCSTECIDDNGNQSNCGDYGVCDACREALVEIGRVLIGQKAKETFWGICEFKWHYNVTYQSVNSSSCQTYTRCETETETHNYLPDVDVYCCDLLSGGCFGQIC